MRGEICVEEFNAEMSVMLSAPNRLYVPCFCLQIHEGGEIDERNVNLVYLQGGFDICHSIE